MEIKLLKFLISKLNGKKTSILLKTWFLLLVWLVLVAVIVVLLQLQQRELISNFLFLIICLGLGGVVGVGAILRMSEKQWPFILPHLSKESIENRINEIET